MYCNGAQIRKLRAQLGLTQEMLAIRSAINIRTVQRAENGEPLELETFNQIAQALNTTPLAIQTRRSDGDDEANENGFIILRPTLEGAKLVLAIRNSFESEIEFDAEPTEETIESLVNLVEKLRKIAPQPWSYSWVMGEDRPSDTEVLRIQLDVTKHINQLAANGVDVFVGSYIAARKQPHLSEEGELYTSTKQRPERKTIVRVRISNTGLERIKIAVDDEWKEPDFDDEIPF